MTAPKPEKKGARSISTNSKGLPLDGRVILALKISFLFFTMLAAFANFERLRIKERTEEGRKGKRARRGFMGGRIPYGFSVVGKGRDALLTPHEQEQEIVAIVQRMTKDGHSPSRICRFLNFKDYSTREGKPWAEMQVIRIINQGQEKAA